MDAMEQRRNTIVELVNQSGNISFAQLKKKIPQISEMTLRTDLKALDEAKRIVRDICRNLLFRRRSFPPVIRFSTELT